jgi:hypothetical protein
VKLSVPTIVRFWVAWDIFTYNECVGVIPGGIRRGAGLYYVTQTKATGNGNEYTETEHENNAGPLSPKCLELNDKWHREDEDDDVLCDN